MTGHEDHAQRHLCRLSTRSYWRNNVVKDTKMTVWSANIRCATHATLNKHKPSSMRAPVLRPKFLVGHGYVTCGMRRQDWSPQANIEPGVQLTIRTDQAVLPVHKGEYEYLTKALGIQAPRGTEDEQHGPYNVKIRPTAPTTPDNKYVTLQVKTSQNEVEATNRAHLLIIHYDH